jgi:hypothetical protein
LETVGFDPHRKYRATRLDYAVVFGAFAVIAAIVAWAFFG